MTETIIKNIYFVLNMNLQLCPPKKYLDKRAWNQPILKTTGYKEIESLYESFQSIHDNSSSSINIAFNM